ncbi:S1C family serine protease [Miltoncostaea marina]|uniref:S1C family serine protease n=1 Tax=Miltoncostaea marina TaxID=2843215 RepID=UPI001C3E7D41|nr:trypsin-like peptidase domain-containing protein [Miltoncostaea marina]
MRLRGGEALRILVAASVGGLVTGLLLAVTGLPGAAGAAGAATWPSGADVSALYAAAAPSVAAVDAGGRTGSAVVLDARHLVTNAHVVGDAERVEVAIGDRRVGARVRGVEPSVDVAVLRLDGVEAGVPALPLAPAAALRVGDPVIAIGAPFGLQGSLSTGVVSGLRRQIDSPNGFAITGVIQTDAALNPGNSGGPLLDMDGRVVGIATQIATEGGRNEGIGFAVPADVVARTAERIVATGAARLPYLGIVGQGGEGGVRLADVLRDGPARGVLRPGDVVVAVGGRPVDSSAAIADALADRRPGEAVRVTVLRDGRRLDLDVRLAVRPVAGPA